ncbi:MAG: hypothetical protein DRJ96_06390 [Thermoprotei archaeon]|nr:MAG: hypothetical protein DRJ96_06390 [Thermoprotei archaeon]
MTHRLSLTLRPQPTHRASRLLLLQGCAASSNATKLSTRRGCSLTFSCLYARIWRVKSQVRERIGGRASVGLIYRHSAEVFWRTLSEKHLKPHGVERVYACRDAELLLKGRTSYVIGELSALADPIAWVNLRRPRELKLERVAEEDLTDVIVVSILTRLRKEPLLSSWRSNKGLPPLAGSSASRKS